MTGARWNRRRVLTGGALALGGAVTGGVVAGGATAATVGGRGDEPAGESIDPGTAVEPFYGRHQAGIATAPQGFASFVAFTLQPEVDRAALGRMMRLLTDDAARLTRGEPALADTEPELALLPARLTVTFGFGPALFDAAGLAAQRPPSVADLPPFPRIDRLEQRWSGGDLLLQICADDPTTVAHAQRMLIKDARPFASVRWVQQGFLRSPGVREGTSTPRNLMGQLDGTTNPRPGTDDFDAAVWATDGPQWHRGGSTLVVRRITVELETWDQLGRAERELVVGRRMDNGAPLTGHEEHDEPDFAAVNAHGLSVIPEFSHISRARVADPRLQLLRRGYNYDGVPDAAGRPDSGLIFASYQADVDKQFLPVQHRIAEQDFLNEWVIPIGSAVFAVPPGCEPGGWIGEGLLG